jgi:WD40 repeat protein
MDEGDQVMACKPWLGDQAASIPDEYLKLDKKKQTFLTQIPNQNLSLHYAHGFRGFDARNNLKYTDNPDHIVYTTAALGVVLDKSSNVQSFYNDHDDDLICLDIHPNKQIVATGQMAHANHAKAVNVNVWNISDMSRLAILKGFHHGNIKSVRFSPSGDKLITVGGITQYSVAVYDWKKNQKIADAKVDSTDIFGSLWINENEFITYGVKHLKHFTLSGTTLNPKSAQTGKVANAFPVFNYVFHQGWNRYFSGGANGSIIEWAKNTATKSH